MPNRLIREGWLDSTPVSRLSAEAERFFLRLFLAADDAGRFDGRPVILKTRCFPILIGIDEPMVKTWMVACHQAGLLEVYEHGGMPYIQIAKFQRVGAAGYSKYPWKDGSHRIDYVKRETRDGRKEFVATSLPDGVGRGSVGGSDGVGMGSVGGRHGVQGFPEKSPESETETKTGVQPVKVKSVVSAEIAATPPALDTPDQKQVTSDPPASTPRPQRGGSLPPDTGGVPPGHPETQERPVPVVSKRFSKPTPQEVEAYGREIGFSEPNLGAAFCDFYEAGGWKIGPRPMKDWKAAVRTWKHRRGREGGPNGRKPEGGRIAGAAGYQPGKYSHLP